MIKNIDWFRYKEMSSKEKSEVNLGTSFGDKREYKEKITDHVDVVGLEKDDNEDID